MPGTPRPSGILPALAFLLATVAGGMPAAAQVAVAPTSTVPAASLAGRGADAEVHGFAPWLSRNLDRVVEGAIGRGATPGAAVVVGHDGEVVLARGYGRADWAEDAPPVTEHTVWDLASVTKITATTLAAMILYEEGRLDLDASLAAYLEAWPYEGELARVTPRLLLAHRAGLPAGAPVWRYGGSLDERVQGIVRRGLVSPPGTEERYSDLGPILMGFVVETVTGESLEDFVEERVYRRLGLVDTGFRPLAAGIPPERIAPTERVEGELLRGVVHDPNARGMEGVAGNAGVFASAADLARLAAALLWERPGRLVCRDVIREFTARPDPGTRFSAGFEMPAHWSMWSEVFSEEAFGHTGYTGTSLWIDPVQDVFVVLLTSRVNPTAANRLHLALRRELHDLVRRAHLHLEEEERRADWRLPEVWRGVDSCRAEAGFAALAGVPAWVFTLR